MPADTLIIGYGNPARGDDALGPLALAAIEKLAAAHPEWSRIECLTDFQLQVEFVTDLVGRRRVVFIDASADCIEPFAFGPLVPRRETSTSHALSPASLLTVYRKFHGEDPPPCFLLAIRGHDFELGSPLSERARTNLLAAVGRLEQWLIEECSEVAHDA